MHFIGFSGKSVKLHKRPAPLSASHSSFHKPSLNNRRYGGLAAASQKPLWERIIHLLALKAYRKPELLLWMEREGASLKDKSELGGVLEEVCRNTACVSVPPGNCSHSTSALPQLIQSSKCPSSSNSHCCLLLKTSSLFLAVKMIEHM